ncbi:MAG: hypothetical protein WCY08_01780 [Rhodocyclaceae bacterium]
MIGAEVPIDDVEFERLADVARYAAPSFFADGATYEEIAAALAAEEGGKPLSRARIMQIERRALMKVRRALEARGIKGPASILPPDE